MHNKEKYDNIKIQTQS